jgi:chemotaxis protein histidine kinase CheA
MLKTRRILALLAAGAFLCALAAHGQDSQDSTPSLGDAARQARQQKQQKDAGANKDAAAKSAPSKDAQSNNTPAKDAQPNGGQTKDAQAKDSQTPKAAKRVITNDEIPEHIGPTHNVLKPEPGETVEPGEENAPAAPAAYWKSQILAQKNAISSLESQIANLSDSIQYAGGNCVANCVQWNERQQQKQQQVDVMKQQLEQQQKRLEDLQDQARKQGFGSSVYDP